MSTVFALPTENDFGDTVPNGVAGPMGLFITVLLVIATVFLIRNMNARLKRLPESFPPPGERAPGRTESGGEDSATGAAVAPAEPGVGAAQPANGRPTGKGKPDVTGG